MKKLLTIAGILIASFASAQYAPMTAYGYKYKRLMADSTLHIPNFCGVPTLQDTTTKKAAIAFDSCNNRLYFYNPKTFTWGYFSGGGFDTTTIYETINNLTQYVYDSLSSQFMPAGILLDTTYFVAGTDDSVRAYVYTDSTVIYDTLGRSLLTSITNNITNILQILDSARSDTSFHIVVDSLLNGLSVIVVHDPLSRNDTIFYNQLASNPTRGGYMPKEAWSLFGTGENGIISGGRVTWLTNYTYNVSEAYYRIDSVIYHSPSTDITLDAAHATLDRIDLFLLTTSNTAVKLTGTAGSGIPPDYDASLYLEASFALVTANTTSPPNIVQKWIYQENLGTAGGEFTVVANSVRMNVNSTSNPDLGSKDIEGTNVLNNDYFRATAGAGFTMTPYNVLSFRIRSKGNFGRNKKIVIGPMSSPTNGTGRPVVIGSGSYGFTSTQTTTYQTITIPLSHFGTMTNPNSFEFRQSNTSGTAGWYIDNIQLQNVQITTSGVYVTDITKNATGDSFYVWKDGNITRRLKDSIGSGGGSGSGISEVIAGYGLTNVNDSTLKADTLLLSTRAWRNKGIDSVRALIPAQFNPIAGTNVTITGSYPNMTFNSSGGGGGSSKVYPPLVLRNDSISTRFNVRYYGATGDSTQDATTYIQAAIDACSAAGGGTVYFPNGFYWINGALVTSGNNPNSQIVIPPTAFESNARTYITFEGETKPHFTPALRFADIKYPRSGVIIKSTITGSGIMPAIFGGNSVATYVAFKNLAILVPANAGATGPTMSAINAYLYPSVDVNYCVIGIDTSLMRDTIPQNEVAGIITPKTLCEPMTRISNTCVYGFRFGVIAGEHTVLDKLYTNNNYAGVVMQKSAHPVTGHILSQWNYIEILIPNSSIMQGTIPAWTRTPMDVRVDVEKHNGNIPARWFDNLYTLADSGNRVIGRLNYYMASGTVYTKNGGTNTYFREYALDSGFAVGSNYQVQLSINKYLASSANFTYNSSTDVLNIGGAITTTGNYTATHNFAAANTAISLTNTSSGASASEIIKVINNAGVIGGMAVFSSAATGGLTNTVLLSGSNKTRIASASGVSTGGAYPVEISAGGYDQVRATFFSNGGVGIGQTTDSTSVKFHVSGTGLMSSLYGSVGSGGNLGLGSTLHATKGFITFGTSAYDETNNRLGVGTAAPSFDIHASKTVSGTVQIRATNSSTNAAAYAGLYVANSSSLGGLVKTSTAYTPYKTEGANDLAIYNSGGNITLLNDAAGGNINMTAGGASTAHVIISSAGAVRMSTYGAGTATFDASGNITSVSDERLKTSIRPYKTGLKELMNINPITYKWNKSSGNETNGTYAGFSAQNVKANIPFGTGENDKGYLSLQDRALLGAAINAIKELNEKVIRLETEIKALKSK